MGADPESPKKTDDLTVYLALSGSIKIQDAIKHDFLLPNILIADFKKAKNVHVTLC